MRRIIQLLTTVDFGDAVSNDALAIHGILQKQGYETGIYAENIDSRIPKDIVKPVKELPSLNGDDCILYHASTGTRLNFDLPALPGRKIMIYHNITPAHFFEGYSAPAVSLTHYGYEGIRFLADKVQYCIADSEYNKQELRNMGYSCPIDVCPILIPFEDYDREPDLQILRQYQDDGDTNLLFVGRIAPNKKQEDIIRAFWAYQRHYNARSRLILAGNSNGMEIYDQRLRRYADLLGVSDKVTFTGQIRFNSILAYYRTADVFVCMSEHEGFCVPLLEAMHFRIPILAFRSSAVPETLGRGGLLLDEKDPYTAAAAIDRLAKDQDLRASLIKTQQEKLREYDPLTVSERLAGLISAQL